MKKSLLVLALAGLAFSCKSTDAEVTTSADAVGGCCATETECADEAASCSTESSCEEGEAKVCPVTGATN